MELYIMIIILAVVFIGVLIFAIKMLGDMMINSQKQTTDMQNKRLSELNEQLTARNDTLQKTVNDMLKQIETRLNLMQEDNNKKLEQIFLINN